jgi:HD-like signal output (HDOD) protein
VSPDSTRGEKLQEFLREISEGADFPAVSRAIEQVLAHTAEETPIQHIANLILKDYSITLKILRTANSAFYNRSSRPILTISHAVSLMGIEAIRQIVVGLVLIDQFGKRSPGLKELMLLSLLSANHAREVADLTRYPRREEAYLCGMFRNLGEVLVACFRPREYAAILLSVHEDLVPVEQASLKILGFRYEDLGIAIAARWSIPESVQAVMREPAFHRRHTPVSDADRLTTITNFAHKLTNAVYRREPQAARASISLLLKSLGPALGLSQDTVRSVVERSLEETGEVFRAMRVPLDRLRLARQTEAALLEIHEDPEAVTLLDPPAEPDLLGRMVTELEGQVDSGSCAVHSVTLMVLEAIYRAGPFDRVLFALLDADRNRLVGKLGFGDGIDQVIDQFNFPSRGADPIAAAVIEKTDVWVDTAHDRRYQGTRFLQTLGAPAFGLFPVVVEGVVVGCLYFDRRTPKNADPATLRGVSALRDQLCRAVSRSRTADTHSPVIQSGHDPRDSAGGPAAMQLLDLRR